MRGERDRERERDRDRARERERERERQRQRETERERERVCRVDSLDREYTGTTCDGEEDMEGVEIAES